MKLIMKRIKGELGGTILRSLTSLSVLDSPVAAIDGVFNYLEAILMINKSWILVFIVNKYINNKHIINPNIQIGEELI